MRLYLIRHPRTVAPSQVCYGSSDVQVADHEREMCLRELLADASLPAGLPVYSSPLLRCAELAYELAAAWGVSPPMIDARLSEMHFGDWELLDWAHIPRAEIDAWAADMAGFRPGKGECVLDMARRVLAFRSDMAVRGEDACVVCHAGTIRLLAAAGKSTNLHDVAEMAAGTPARVGYGQLIVITI